MKKTIPELLEGCEEKFVIYVRDSCINELERRVFINHKPKKPNKNVRKN